MIDDRPLALDLLGCMYILDDVNTLTKRMKPTSKSTIVVCILLFITVITSIWIILSVKMIPSLRIQVMISSDYCHRINEVSVNLAYSFLAGYFFYVLTVWLPKKMDAIRRKPILAAEFENIEVGIRNVCTMFFDGYQPTELLLDPDICAQHMSSIDWTTKSHFFPPFTKKTIVGKMTYMLEDLENSISEFIMIYGSYLETDQHIALNRIRHSIPTNFFKIFETLDINNDNKSPLIEEYCKFLSCYKDNKKYLN